MIGVRGLGAEVCKNLVLAGIRSLTVLDPANLEPDDVAGRFLTPKEGENVSRSGVGSRSTSECFLILCRGQSKHCHGYKSLIPMYP